MHQKQNPSFFEIQEKGFWVMTFSSLNMLLKDSPLFTTVVLYLYEVGFFFQKKVFPAQCVHMHACCTLFTLNFQGSLTVSDEET